MCDSDEDQTGATSVESPSKDISGRQILWSWLNKYMKVVMTDGRILVGYFVCTDRDANVILGSCNEYLKPDEDGKLGEEPRMLGLAMIPGRHIVSVHIEDCNGDVDDSLALNQVLDDSELLMRSEEDFNCNENGVATVSEPFVV